MSDAPAEDGFLRIDLVQMHRVAVSRDVGEEANIVILDGLGETPGHADLQILDADRAAQHIVQHGLSPGARPDRGPLCVAAFLAESAGTRNEIAQDNFMKRRAV